MSKLSNADFCSEGCKQSVRAGKSIPCSAFSCLVDRFLTWRKYVSSTSFRLNIMHVIKSTIQSPFKIVVAFRSIFFDFWGQTELNVLEWKLIKLSSGDTHGVRTSKKKSHSTLQAKRATFTF